MLVEEIVGTRGTRSREERGRVVDRSRDWVEGRTAAYSEQQRNKLRELLNESNAIVGR